MIEDDLIEAVGNVIYDGHLGPNAHLPYTKWSSLSAESKAHWRSIASDAIQRVREHDKTEQVIIADTTDMEDFVAGDE